MDKYDVKAKVYKKMRDGMMNMRDGDIEHDQMVQDYPDAGKAAQGEAPGGPGSKEMKFAPAKKSNVMSSEGISSFMGESGEVSENAMDSNMGDIYSSEPSESKAEGSSNYGGQRSYHSADEPEDGSSEGDFDSKDSFAPDQEFAKSRKKGR